MILGITTKLNEFRAPSSKRAHSMMGRTNYVAYGNQLTLSNTVKCSNYKFSQFS